MTKYFGIDGFRDRVGHGLIAAHTFEIGRFLGWSYGRSRRAQVAAGKCTRRSSYMLEYALSAGLTASGADVYLLHVTTPPVSYAVRVTDKKVAQEDSEVQAAVQAAEAALGGRGPHSGPGVRHRTPGPGHGGGRKPGPLPGAGGGLCRSSVGEVGRMRTAGAPGRRGGGEP